MNLLELEVDIALKIVNPLSAIHKIKGSKKPIVLKLRLFERVLAKVVYYSKKRNSLAVKSLLELFWQFWIVDDLDHALCCLQHLAECELNDKDKVMLDVMVSIFTTKCDLRNELFVFA